MLGPECRDAGTMTPSSIISESYEVGKARFASYDEQYGIPSIRRSEPFSKEVMSIEAKAQLLHN
jgi:hypothetical protein